MIFNLLLLILLNQGGEKMDFVKKIHWLGHASMRIDAEKIIYIDPWKIKGGKTADLILITHDHYDHCSPDDVRKIQGKDTVIVTIKACAEQLKGNVKIVKPGDTIEPIKGVKVTAVPSYNRTKQFHPKSKGYVGYVIEVEGVKVYHAGDTDFIDEMKSLNVDIALLPVGGTYTMDWREAVEAVKSFKPKIAIPMHWGDIVGSEEDAKNFCNSLKENCVILKKE
jgi:L-ascorbate metabolism protein UlaG (beta-lactamase superfamily)